MKRAREREHNNLHHDERISKTANVLNTKRNIGFSSETQNKEKKRNTDHS